jgi:protein phosphatase
VRARLDLTSRYVDAYRRDCWPVSAVDDLRLAPFHLLATEGKVHVDRDHAWHMEALAKVGRADPALLLATPYRVVDLVDPRAQEEAVRWWEDLAGRGGEGMVVERFVRREPLQRVHECVFGVLALESEPADPRL